MAGGRAIAIATRQDYQTVYTALTQRAKAGRSKPRGRATPRDGVQRKIYQPYLESLGWQWHATMTIGSGTTVHLTDGELPGGRLIVRLSKHLTTVIDGVIYDTFDPQREVHAIERDVGQDLKPGQWRNENGICSIQRRAVYGYFKLP